MWQAYAALSALQLIQGAQQAESIRANAALSKQLGEMNAQYAELDAYRAEQSGESQAARYQTVIDSTIGAQKTVQAAQNVDINFGTAKAVREESRLNGFLNQLDIRNQAHERALGYINQARNLRLQGRMGGIQSEANATATQNAAILNAAATGLKGISGYSSGKVQQPTNSESDWSKQSGQYSNSGYLGVNTKF